MLYNVQTYHVYIPPLHTSIYAIHPHPSTKYTKAARDSFHNKLNAKTNSTSYLIPQLLAEGIAFGSQETIVAHTHLQLFDLVHTYATRIVPTTTYLVTKAKCRKAKAVCAALGAEDTSTRATVMASDGQREWRRAFHAMLNFSGMCGRLMNVSTWRCMSTCHD